MPFDGNGIYEPLPPPDFPAVPGTLIRASQYNNQILDIAAALSNCITVDGQSQITGDIPMNGHKITGLATGTGPGDAVTVGQLKNQPFLPLARDLFALSTGGTTLTISAVAIIATESTNQNPIISTGVSAACNIQNAQTGSQIGGRDQAALFPNNVWVSYYYCVRPDGTGGGVLASLSATDPVLPTGYTHKYFIATILRDTSGNIRAGYLVGDRYFYTVGHSLGPVSATTLATLSLTAVIPPNAATFRVGGEFVAVAVSGTIDCFFDVGVNGQVNYRILRQVNAGLNNGSTWAQVAPPFDLPNINQVLYYQWGVFNGTGSQAGSVIIYSYTVSNGAG